MSVTTLINDRNWQRELTLAIRSIRRTRRSHPRLPRRARGRWAR